MHTGSLLYRGKTVGLLGLVYQLPYHACALHRLHGLPDIFLYVAQAQVGRAEAASAAASGGLSGLSVGSDMLTPLISRAKQQLEVERAKGSLHKAMAAAKTNADLPQLDAAIQAAHKAGLQDRVTEASRCPPCCLVPTFDN